MNNASSSEPLLEIRVQDDEIQSGQQVVNIPESENAQGFVIGNYHQIKQYSQQLLDEASGDHQYWGRLKPVLKRFGRDAVTTAATIGITFGASRKILGDADSTVQMLMMNSITSSVTVLGKPLKKIGTIALFHPKGDALAAAVMKTAIGKLDKAAQDILTTQSPQVQAGIQSHIDDLKSKVDAFKKNNPFNLNAVALKKSWSEIIEMLTTCKGKENTYQHDVDGNEAAGRVIDAAQKRIIENFPKDVQEGLHNIASTHRYHSINSNVDQPFHILEGPPAVGKTYAVREIAKTLGSTLIETNADKLADFLGVPRKDGTSPNATFDYDLWKYMQPEPEIWTKYKKEATSKNVILFADEISFKENQHLLPSLKRWMTGETPPFPNSNNVTSFPKVTVIMASNEDLYNQLGDDALKSRVSKCIKFPNWPFEKLEDLAEKHIDKIRDSGRGVFHDESSDKTCGEVKKLLSEAVIPTVKKYKLGTFTLRDMQKTIERYYNKFQLDNDIGFDHDLNSEKEGVKTELKELLENRNSSAVPLNLLGGHQTPKDCHTGALFLKGLEARGTETTVSSETQEAPEEEQLRAGVNPAIKKTCNDLKNLTEAEINNNYQPEEKNRGEEQWGYLVKKIPESFYYFQRPIHGMGGPSLYKIPAEQMPGNMKIGDSIRTACTAEEIAKQAKGKQAALHR